MPASPKMNADIRVTRALLIQAIHTSSMESFPSSPAAVSRISHSAASSAAQGSAFRISHNTASLSVKPFEPPQRA